MKTPLSLVYGAVVGLRRALFKYEIKIRTKVNRPVVVVGNITAGGSGKTPTLLFLLSLLKKRNIQSGVVSRGYKGEYKGLGQVDLSEPNCAKIYGDEPCLIKSKYPQVPLYLHPKRVIAAQSLISDHPNIEVILSDDGFQHLALERDLNILLIDSTEPIENYQLLPKGRLREPLTEVKRAQFILFTKVNWAGRAQLKKIKQLIGQYFPLTEENHAEVNFSLVSPEMRGERVLLLSSIAKPDIFEKSIRDSVNVEIAGHIIFPDHHSYRKVDVDRALSDFVNKKCDFVMTTEKDLVKLSSYPDLLSKLKVIGLKLEIVRGQKEFESEFLNVFN